MEKCLTQGGRRLKPTRLVIEVHEIVVHETDEPDALTHLRDAHPLAGEDLAQVDLASVVADAATVRGSGVFGLVRG